MADWAPIIGARIESIGANTSGSVGTVVTASGTANVKGSWTQLVASTEFTSSRLMVMIVSNNLTTYLLDIGVGGAGSETILIPDIHYSGSNLFPFIVDVPVGVPAGSRLAARVASATASAAMSVSACAIAGGSSDPSALSRVVTYGALSASSKGTAVDPGGTVNTKGSWVEFSSSTAVAHKGLLIGVGNNNNTAASSGSWLVDVGIGAAGSELVAVPDFRVAATTVESVTPSASPFVPVSIPAGSRLAMRAQSNLSVDTTDRVLSFVLHGVS